MRAGEGKENENKEMHSPQCRQGHLDIALPLCSAGQLASEQIHDTKEGAFPPSGHSGSSCHLASVGQGLSKRWACAHLQVGRPGAHPPLGYQSSPNPCSLACTVWAPLLRELIWANVMNGHRTIRSG